MKTPEYPTLPCGDCSRTAYKTDGLRLFVFSPSFSSLREEKEGEENGESGAPVCRLSLNNPPTSVGGISDFSHSLAVGGIWTMRAACFVGCLSREPHLNRACDKLRCVLLNEVPRARYRHQRQVFFQPFPRVVQSMCVQRHIIQAVNHQHRRFHLYNR